MASNKPVNTFDSRLAAMRNLAIKKSIVWFLWVNILFSTFILGRAWFAPPMAPVVPMQPHGLLETMMVLVLTLSSGVLFILKNAPLQDAPWLSTLARVCVPIVGVSWGVVFCVLIASGDLWIIFPFAALLLFTALLSLYFDPKVLLSFIVPLWLMIFVASLVYAANLTVLNSMMWLLLAGLLESGRRALNDWFLLALQREQENSELIHRLGRLAHRDPLTGLANRRGFEKRLGDEILRCQLLRESFVLIMLDVDHFKRYNDHYGHPAGDRCLVAIAQVLKQVAEQVKGTAGRFGGEEFVMLLPPGDESWVADVAQAIADRLAAENIVHLHSPVLPRITVSQGIARWLPGMDAQMLITSADNALYQAKARGRNGWVSATLPTQHAVLYAK